jgi:hypothetical protein
MNPTDQELLEMRKGLRKRKLPKISEQMFGEALGIGSFQAIETDYVLSIEWHITFWRLAQWRISKHKTVNTPQKLMRGRMFN